MGMTRAFFRTAFSERYRVKTLFILFGSLFFVALFINSGNRDSNNISNRIESDTPAGPKFTEKQVRIAKNSWRIITRDLREAGLVCDIKETSGETIIYVEGVAWKALPYEAKKDLYRNIIRTKEILNGGDLPKVEVRDYRSGKVYAERGVFFSEVYE